MIVMNLQVDNLYGFKDFHMNMSYPKKILNSSIEEEFLPGFPNFRYKRINILMGGNATGKTSIGKLLMNLFIFINKREIMLLAARIKDIAREARLVIDFIPQRSRLYRMDICIPPEDNKEYALDKCKIFVGEEEIRERDSYETCVLRLEKKGLVQLYPIRNVKGPCCPVKEQLELKRALDESKGLWYLDMVHFGWYFTYPLDAGYIKGVDFGEPSDMYLQVLQRVLVSLDPSIWDIRQLEGVKNTYVIRTGAHELLIKEGKLEENSILSSGTKAGIDVAGLLTAMLGHNAGFYYCDEKFSYIHSDIEKTLLSIMASVVRKGEQLFFTTHNMDILDMDFPKHSFLFLKREGRFQNMADHEEQSITCVSASEFLKKSTDSVRNAMMNDLFGIAPRVESLYELENLLEEEGYE